MKHHYCFCRKFGFTLAEVLITLGIIGVVAALTLPSLIEQHQKKVTVTALKKMYSTLTQSAELYQAKNDVSITEFDTSLPAQDFMEKYFNPNLKVIKTCLSSNQCWGRNNLPVHIDKKTSIYVEYGLILADGSILAINKTPVGAIFTFDVNGTKGPNRSGRDIFNFYLINKSAIAQSENYEYECQEVKNLESGLYPGGAGSCHVPFTTYTREELLGTNVHRSCNSNVVQASYLGSACAAVIMKDGWQIAPDYPW